MKASEAHNLRDDELVERLRQAREEQFALRLQHATGELENTSRIGEARRDVAKLLTVAKERGIDLERELRA
jgi:large subunit ribosomal protein L29